MSRSSKQQKGSEPLGTRNFYKILPKAIAAQGSAHAIDYPNKSKINIHLPSGICVIGATGSCKTNWVLNFIEQVDSFDRVTIYAKKLDEVLYIYLIGCLDAAGIEHEEFDNLDSVIPCSEYDSKKNNLVIIDDFMSAGKSLEPICDLFTMGRKAGITPIYLAQSYFKGVPQTIRLNVNYIVVMKIKSRSDMARILTDVSVDLDKDQMMELLKYIRSLGDTHFMLIDKVTNRDDLKLRINFDSTTL
jgi:hypothetical protein